VPPQNFEIERIYYEDYEECREEQSMSYGKQTKPKKSRILCGGMCITGPKSGDKLSYVVLCLVTTSSLVCLSYMIRELASDNVSIWYALYLSMTTLFGLATALSQLCVQCSDPGILFMFGR